MKFFSSRGFCTYFLCVCFSISTIIAGNTDKEKAQQLFDSFSNGNAIEFIENKGQVADMNQQKRPEILFVGDGGGAKLFMQSNTISYVYVQYPSHKDKREFEKGNVDKKKNRSSDTLFQGYRIDMEFLGANATPQITNEIPSQGYFNYYLPQCPDGVTGLKGYHKLTYHNMYNNIDVVFSGQKNKGLKYDIVVKQGGNVNDIQLKYSGQESLKIQNGKLYVQTKLGEIEEYLPKVYQKIDEKTIDVSCKYELKNGNISFNIPQYNKAYELIIDPWVTYYGSSGIDGTLGMSIDPAGNLLISGYTGSVNFPNAAGGFQGTYGGGTGTLAPMGGDAFILKFSPSGTPIWATYYGGSGDDDAYGIASDPTGDILVTGVTKSANFPVSGAFQGTYAGAGGTFNWGDAFVLKFSTAGLRLWGSYLGGASDEIGWGIASDPGGNALITGFTVSNNFPVTGGAFQTTFGGGAFVFDTFIAKISSAGVPSWITYFGMAADDLGRGITSDAVGNVIVTGSTGSTNLPTTPGTAQPVYGGWNSDIFVAKFDPAGALIWNTFYGGSDNDAGFGITCDALDNIIFTGTTFSTNFPVSASAFQTTIGASQQQDAFVVKLTSAGALLWATYLGANGKEEGYAVTTDAQNTIYVSGDTYSPDFPVTSCAAQTTFAGAEDGYFATFDPLGNRICSSYLGGSSTGSMYSDDENCVIAFYNGTVYLAGSTPGQFLTTSGAYQTTYAGGQYDLFIASYCGKVCGTNNTTINFLANTTSFCPGSAVNFTPTLTACDTASSQFKWTFTGGTPATSSVRSPQGITYNTAGNFSVKLVVTTACGKDSITKNSYITVNPCGGVLSANTTKTDVTCNGKTDGSATVTALNGTANYTYSWSNGTGSITTATTNVVTGLSATTYTVTITDGTPTSVTTTVTITQPNAINTGSPVVTNAACGSTNGNIVASASGGAGNFTYSWSNSVSGATNNAVPAGIYTLTVTDGNSCSATTTATVVNSNGPTVTLQSTTNTCIGKTDGAITIQATGTSLTYSWSNNTTIQNQTNMAAGTYTVTVKDGSNCTATLTATVGSFPLPTANAGTDQTITSGTSIQLNASGGTLYLWSPSSSLDNATISNPIANPTQTTTYIVLVTDANSCTATDDITITVTSTTVTPTSCTASETDEFVANVFTPNGDGRNDVLSVKGSGLTNIYFAIYNRWGQLLFEATDQIKGWDGTQNNKPIDEQTVVYYLKATCITTGAVIEKKGDVLLMR